jgi:predicted SpoU family rRNA methylase
MRIDHKKVLTAVLACLGALVSATYAHASNFTIGGTVSGLTTGKSVTLLDNGTDALTVTANGKFTFKTALATGATYNVTVGTQPSGETCTVTAGSGTVGTTNVTTVKVTCKVPTFTIGGTLSGLITGRSITLLDNGASALKVTKNGAFTFKTALPSGASYNVTISVQPAGETCSVTGGSGKVGTSNVTTVKVSCTPNNYTIGGTVSGLTTGKSVTLLDNGTDSLTVTANGVFTFAKSVASGSAYKVTVKVQPPGETCTVTGGSGTVVSSNVTTVVVSCKPKTFTIGGTVSGLNSGASVTLLDNGTDSLTVTANGKFTFKTALASGAAYNVTISVQPTGGTCTVSNGSGTVGSSNVTNVTVSCAASSTFSIGGTVSGLNSGTSVTLLDNGTDALTVTANGTFTFSTKLASGAAYNVTVGTQPTGETCTVSNGSGTVGSSNVTNVAVSCAASSTFSIGGTVSGLNSGTSVTLLDNGTDSLTVTANGTFTFKTKLASGAAYDVTVGTQPTGETCTVANGSGTVGSSNVTNVAVSCSAGSGGGGAYWIPYSATPIPNQTPAGKQGLFLIPSDKLSSAPTPTFITTDVTQLLGIGTKITESGGVLTYSPQVMMYADTNSSGTTNIFGLTLAGTSTVPTPNQISNLAVPSGQQICQGAAASLTDVTNPTTLFLVIEVGTSAQCSSGGGTYEVVHYTDSSTTAPVVVNINTTIISSVYQNGKLVGLLLFESTTSSFNLYADDTFKSPTQLITSLSGVNYVAGVLDAATLSTTGFFFSVTSTTSVNALYRIDGSTLTATQIQNLASANIGSSAQDDNNLYYLVLTPGTSSSLTATINQVALTGGTPKLLYTSPSFVTGTTQVAGYQLIGSNDSVVAFEFYSIPFTNGVEDPTKATATLYSVPVGTTTTTPTTLANYTAGNELPEVFVAAPTGSGYPGNVLFATVQNSTGTPPLVNVSYSAQSIPLNGGKAPAPIANSVYAPLAIISNHLTDNVWQVTGITDTNGGYGGGTANLVNVSNLTDTPFTTTGGGNYVFPAGFVGSLFAISSNNIALGFWENTPAVERGTATLQENGAAADLGKSFLLPISLTNTEVLPY